MTTTKRMTAAALALLLLLSLTAALPGKAWAEKTYGEPNRFNVVLVVDKSGSLASENGTGTDPDGLRFDALRLFLGLLTESGNNVGAIVFDEFIRCEAAIEPLDGMEEKKALIRKVEAYYPGYDTDIGSAMLRAGEMLREMKQKNNLPCMILLFSDGMTDFTTGDLPERFRSSWGNAEQAVRLAQEEGIVINGILLNVKDTAERGREEFRLYTSRTTRTVTDENGAEKHATGEYEEVTQAADLAPAFRRLYQLVTNAAYTGDQRVSFSEEGEAEIFFTVPSFGVEEVNVIIEGEDLRRDSDRNAGRVSLEIFRPDGTAFDADGHTLENVRYLLCKIPQPALGIWHVVLKGKPNDWVDVAMVGNPSLSVTLRNTETVESYSTYTPYTFAAQVADSAKPQLTEEQLGALRAVLVREDLSTGMVSEYPAAGLEGDTFTFDVSFPRGGEYALSTVLSLGDFKVPSDPLRVVVAAAPLVPEVSAITDMRQYGRFVDGQWELELDKLFGADRESGLQYAVSNDYDGRVRVENGVLRVSLDDAQPRTFTLTATDTTEQTAQIAFDVTAPAVETTVPRVTNILEQGSYADSRWETALDALFDDPKGSALTYVVSDDQDGAVTIEDGVLHVRLDEDGPVTFTVTATDISQQSAKIPVNLSVPTVTAKLERVTNMMSLGQLNDYVWELPLDGLFYIPDDSSLRYAVSDDYDGAVTIEDGVLRVDFHELREASFDLTAENALDRRAMIPLSLKIPGPTVTSGAISETVKTGLFQEGTWERRVDALFKEPKGTALTYALSDDFGGAAAITDGTLHVDVKGLKEAAFTVSATDEYGMTAALPVTITEKNMTPIYALYAGLGLLALGGAATGIILWLRRRNEEY